MTTFTFEAIRIGTTSGTPSAYDVVGITAVMAGDPTGMSYALQQDGSALLTVLGPQGGYGNQPSYSLPLALEVIFSDGADPNAMFFTIAEQDWTTRTGASGTLQAMYFRDPQTGTEYFVPLGGDVPPVASLQDVLTLGISATGAPRPISGPLAAGQNVLPALTFNDPNFGNLTRSEDDAIRMPASIAAIAYGGVGDDTITGVSGQVDAVSYTELTGAVVIKLHKQLAIKADVGRDVLISIEDAVGSRFDDLIVGNDITVGGYSNVFFGGDGADVIRGRGGNDLIEGNNDADRLFGDSGDDQLFGGAGVDRVDGGRGEDVIYGGAEDDTLLGRQDDDFVQGGFGDDVIFGGTGEDRLYGNEGNDTLDGGHDNDVLFGNADNDILRGRLGDDTLNGGAGEDRLVGGAGADVLNGGDGKDDLYGNSGNDQLFGGAGIDDLFGGKNADILDGGEDNDFLRGENGVDTFVFREIEDMGRDRIMDWEDGRDMMDFSTWGFATFQDLYDLSSNVTGALRIDLANDSDGDLRVVIVENFAKANFDASDVILDIPAV